MNYFGTTLIAMALTAMPLTSNGQTQDRRDTTATALDLDAKYATDLLKKEDMAPDFALQTPDGHKVKLADYRGRYVVIDFWASWCGDCRRDAPEIVKMYEEFKNNGVEFLGISFDTKAEAWKNGIEKLGLKYTQASELKNMRESAVAQAYRIKWIPTIYIINPQGKVAMATVMSGKAHSYLASLFPDNDE